MSKPADFELTDFLPYLLNLAAEVASFGFNTHYKERYGMLRTEWRVLFHLGCYGPQTAKDICGKALLHKTKVSRAVRALEAKRFLTRQNTQKDRRLEILTLTKTGQSVFGELRGAAGEYQHGLTNEFTEDQLVSLRTILKQIIENRDTRLIGAKSN